MEWFSEWWGALTLFQQIFACAAIPGTILLVLQTVMLLFGLGGHDADHGDFSADHDMDHDFDHDVDHDLGHDMDHDYTVGDDNDISHDGAHQFAGIRIFTIRGLVAMFAIGGWLGIAMIDCGLTEPLAALIAIAGGIAALVITGVVIGAASKIQESGNISLKNAVTSTAEVYLTIPPSRTGEGKVTLNVQERFIEAAAVTDSGSPIKTGSMVQVVSVSGGLLVVRPLNNDAPIDK